MASADRLSPGGPLVHVAVVVASLKPRVSFSQATGWEYRVLDEDAASLRQAINGFPVKPSLVIDGGNEVVLAWFLHPPLSLRTNHARVAVAQAAIAQRLGAEPMEVGALIPVPGTIVRNMGSNPPVVTVAHLDTDLKYTLEDLEHAALHQKEAV
jgi:hypothetical protein